MNNKFILIIMLWVFPMIAMKPYQWGSDFENGPLLGQNWIRDITDPVPEADFVMVDESAPDDLPAASNRQDSVEKSAQGWILENSAPQPVYYRWYYAGWDRSKRAFINPEPVEGQPIDRIEPGFLRNLPFSVKKRSGYQRQLIFSFEPGVLSQAIRSEVNNGFPAGILGVSQHDLGSFKSHWQIGKNDKCPTLVPFFNTIKVINTTNTPLLCAMYRVDSQGNAIKAKDSLRTTQVDPQVTMKIHYPVSEKYLDTQLLIASKENSHLLGQDRLSPAELERVYAKSFKQTNWTNWYLGGGEFEILRDVNEKHKIRLASRGGGAIVGTLLKVADIRTPDGVLAQFEEKFRRGHPCFKPAEDIVLKDPIQAGRALNLRSEKEYFEKREGFVRDAINELLGDGFFSKEDDTPKIALVFSGGGYRAMTKTTGYLRGADNQSGGNIFNCCMYMTGLSGSTWAINPLVLSNLRPREFSHQQKYKLRDSRKTLYTNLKLNVDYHQRRFIQSRYGQAHGPVGFYGHALGNALLKDFETCYGKSVHDVTLSDLRINLNRDPGRYPLPISVAIDPGSADHKRTWYEFSPYYVGTHQENGGSWVDTKLFGSTFEGTQLVHQAPEYPLAHYMGIWGSAFALNPDDIAKVSAPLGILAKGTYAAYAIGSRLYGWVKGRAPEEAENADRLAAGEMPNYNYRNPAMPQGVQEKMTINLIDGGIAKKDVARHNFASIPALWRDSDILIMCDSTGNPNEDINSEHLVASDQEAQRFKLAFPTLFGGHQGEARLKRVNEDMERQGYALIIEDNAPIIIYMKGKRNSRYDEGLKQNGNSLGVKEGGFNPAESHAGFTSTFNFEYTDQQFELVAGLTEHIFIESKDAIKQAIREAIKRKR